MPAGLVAPTQGLAQSWLDHLGLDRPPPLILPNPVLDTAGLALSERITAGDGPPRGSDLILVVGRLHRAKGQALALEAFARALPQRRALRMCFLGEGQERAALTAQATSLGVIDRVEMPGFAPNVLDQISRAGLLLVPSEREGFGNVVVEALAVGTPVLATDCDGPRRLLAQAPGAGRIVALNDPAAMAQALVEMTGGSGLLDQARRQGPPLARHYTAEAAARDFADALDRLLTGGAV